MWGASSSREPGRAVAFKHGRHIIIMMLFASLALAGASPTFSLNLLMSYTTPYLSPRTHVPQITEYERSVTTKSYDNAAFCRPLPSLLLPLPPAPRHVPADSLAALVRNEEGGKVGSYSGTVSLIGGILKGLLPCIFPVDPKRQYEKGKNIEDF